jgi:hypothetical protein
VTTFITLIGAFEKLRKVTISFVMSVCPSEWNNWAFTGRIFMKFDISIFFENLSREFKFYYDLKRKMSSLYEDRYTFMIKPRSVFLRMRNVSDRIGREIKTYIFVFNIFSPWNRAVYEWMWKNILDPAGHGKQCNMAQACCMLDKFRLQTHIHM